MDAWGHATIVTEANGVTLTRGYDPATGLGTSVLAAGHDHTGLAQLVMHWDGFGNLAERDDSLNGSTETATYDDLNRLHTTNLSYSGGTLARSFAYDATGNRTRACAGGDCTSYGYGMGHGLLPHAVTSVNGDTSDYAYDANGEMTSDADRSLTWSAFGKAATISQGSYRVSLAYGPDHARTRKTLASGHVTTETVTYLGAAEVLTVNNNTSIRRTLALADVAIIDTGGYGAKLLYPITDHLGSTVALSDGSGDLAAQAMAYSPFGQRRTAGWAQAMPPGTALSINENYTDKGYTGQEELDAVGLVNYNARLYDPALGRFLSVDPLIAHPGSTQSINPYSYVENNPLNKTDPTGMAAETCSGSGANRVCAQMVTPTGSHIAQKVTVNQSTGAVSAGRLTGTDGHSFARSTDFNSMESFSPAGAVAKNSTGSTNVNAHRISNQNQSGDPKATPAQLNAFKKMTWQGMQGQGSDSGKETKFYMDSSGKVLKSGVQTGCNGNDHCTLDDVANATFAGHTHVYPPALQDLRLPPTREQRIAELSRDMPGPGDAGPLAAGAVSGVITPGRHGGYHYVIEGTAQVPTIRYVGGGNPKFGNYIQKNWRPEQPLGWYHDLAESYVENPPK